jgi:hypothetical protein
VWLFTTVGFFSIVAEKDSPRRLVVRARIEEDLDALRGRYLPELSETVKLAARDYRYRGWCSHAAFARAAGRIARDITYSNFKSEVARKQGPAREALYAEIWSLMLNAEQRLVPVLPGIPKR